MKVRLMFMISVLITLTAVFTTSVFSQGFVFVDLKPYVNSQIINTSWWTGNAGSSDLEELVARAKDGTEFDMPWGEKVSFKVIDGNIRLFGTNSSANPKSVEGIKVSAKAKSIYFAHVTGWENAGAPGYKFVINFDNGSKQELLIESHKNSDDWCHIPAQLEDKNSFQFWKEPGATCVTVSIIATKWDNPQAGSTIKTIDAISLETGAVPGIFAITLGGASAPVDSASKLAVMWGHIKSENSNR